MYVPINARTESGRELWPESRNSGFADNVEWIAGLAEPGLAGKLVTSEKVAESNGRRGRSGE